MYKRVVTHGDVMSLTVAIEAIANKLFEQYLNQMETKVSSCPLQSAILITKPTVVLATVGLIRSTSGSIYSSLGLRPTVAWV